MAASVLPASHPLSGPERDSSVEITEGPSAYCDNGRVQGASGGNNMSFSRVLSGDTEIEVSVPLCGARSRGAQAAPVPYLLGPRAALTNPPEHPPSWPFSEHLLCAGCHRESLLGPVGFLTLFCR